MTAAILRVALSASLSVVIACDSMLPGQVQRSTQPAAASTVGPASVTTLPRADEETEIVRALDAEAVRVTGVKPSKFDWLFGSAAPRTGMFEVTFDGQQSWADVHLIDRSLGTVVACSGQPMTGLAGTFSVAADGRRQAAAGSTVTGSVLSGSMYFAVSDRYFVMTPDLHLRDAMTRALRLVIPGCREPIDLPVLSWEQDVVDAFARAGLPLTLIGASKFETTLGDRHPARVFISRTTSDAGGADVLFLERPIAVRMCRTGLSTGAQRIEVFVGDRRVSDAETTQDVGVSVSDHFFVQAVGSKFHDALMRGLGTHEPGC